MKLLCIQNQWLVFLLTTLLASLTSSAQDCSSFEINEISVDHISCHGISNGRIIITCTGGQLPYEYSINNGADFQSFSGQVVMIPGLSAGLFDIVVRDNNQCTVSYDGNPVEIIEPDPLELQLETTRQGCPGDALGEVTALPSGGTMPYTFLWSDQSTTSVITGLEEGLFSCTLTDAGACKVSEDIMYTGFEEVILEIGEDLEILPGEVVQFEVSINIETFSIIQWSPPEGLSSSTVLNPFAGPTESTTYELFVLSADGCSASDQVTVIVAENLNEVVVPNAFSPNGDDLNEVFRPIFTSASEIDMFMIYNRWGQLIYKSTNTQGWDGTFLGLQQPVGTYIYTIQYVNPVGETKQISGELNLIR